MIEEYGIADGAWLMHGLVQVVVHDRCMVWNSCGAWLMHGLVQVLVHVRCTCCGTWSMLGMVQVDGSIHGLVHG
jgi:hypothetical protein